MQGRHWFLVIVAVLIGRRSGRVGGGKRRRSSHGDGYVVGEHRHELFVVETVEHIGIRYHGIVVVIGVGVPAFLHQWLLEESDGVANGTAVSPAACGREVEELLDPRRLVVVRGIHSGSVGSGGNDVCHCWQSLMWKRRPILGHVGYFWR